MQSASSKPPTPSTANRRPPTRSPSRSSPTSCRRRFAALLSRRRGRTSSTSSAGTAPGASMTANAFRTPLPGRPPDMTDFGYALSSEEHGPRKLIDYARKAEETGFEFALISDHFHPWTDAQGQSPFVWSVVGGISQATSRLRLGTGVTCPLIRIHPAIIAHAAATAGEMMQGRFFLGVGSGENLNEHVVGEVWPAPDERLSMLEEAIEVMRLLWQGGEQTHRGDYYDLEQARLYTLPDDPVQLAVAASKPNAAELAGRLGDAFVSTAPDPDVLEKFE